MSLQYIVAASSVFSRLKFVYLSVKC